MTQVALLYPIVMKKKGLPFTIGEQYELHEFELVEVETVLIGDYEYDVYRCSKKLFDSLELDGLIDVKLYYNADILARVDYYFKFDHLALISKNQLPSGKGNIQFIVNLYDGCCVIIAGLKYKFIFNSG